MNEKERNMRLKQGIFYMNVVLDTRSIYMRVLESISALSEGDITSTNVLECTFRAWSMSTNSIVDLNCNGFISPRDAIMITVAEFCGADSRSSDVGCETRFTKLCELCHDIYLDIAPQLDNAWFLVNEVRDIKVKRFVGKDMVVEIEYN